MQFLRAAVIGGLLGLMSCVTTQQSPSLLQGNQYARDSLFREALESYKKALKEEPNNPVIRRNMGIVQVKIGDDKNAGSEILRRA